MPCPPTCGIVGPRCETGGHGRRCEHLVVKRDGDITTVTLDRPEKRNALALDVMAELTAALEAVGGTDARGVVLAANGPVFSAGHNFGDMAGADLRRTPATCSTCARG